MIHDRRLLLLTHQGRESAARELWRRFSPRLLAYAGSIVPSFADDVVQSVFISILKQPRSVIRAVEDPGAWLLTLSRRTALDHIRAGRRDAARRKVIADQVQTAASFSTPETEPLNRALAELPRRLREVVVLRHIAGLTFDQVALALGANRNTAAARYREAIRRLKLSLEPALSGSIS